jgi:gliding motility-associated-like protein
MNSSLRVLFSLLVCLLGARPQLAMGQAAPSFEWATSGGGSGDDQGWCTKVDAAGNTYAAGIFSNTATFQSARLVSQGGRDTFLAKFNPQGQLLWLRQLGGAGEEQVATLAIDALGNVILLGQFSSGQTPLAPLSMTIGPFTLQAATPKGELFFAKYDAQGTALWARQSTSPDGLYGLDMALNSGGDIYLSAMLAGPSGTSAQLGQLTVQDFFLAKYNGQGTVQWVKQGLGQVAKIAVDATGFLYLYGSSYTSPSLTLGAITLTANGRPFLYFGQFDAAGNANWAQVLSTPRGTHYPSYMVVTPTHNLIVGEVFGDTLTRGNQTFTASGAEDLLTLCYSPQGQLLWANQLGGPSTMPGGDQLVGPVIDAASNSYVFVRLEGMQTLTQPSGRAGPSYHLVSYSPTGALRWTRPIPDYVIGLGASATGELVLTSLFDQALAFDSFWVTNVGYFDAYVAKLAAVPSAGTIAEPVAGTALPNIITPNGDGLNDKFIVPNLPPGLCQVRIYSRWGQEVYRSADYQQDWAAIGQPAGVYYYLLQLPNQTVTKGWVEVIR